MKTRIYTLCAIAAAFVLAGCQKEKNNVEQTYVGPTHTLTFTAEKMVDSKTAIDSEDNDVVSYKWIEGDMARMEILELYEYDDNGTTKTKGTKGTITDMTISNGGKSATFTAVFSGEVPSALIGYQAAYAGAFSGTHNPQIPAEQSPLPTTFDPAADVLVSEVFADGREESSFVFNMTRKVSVNKMTLKGLTPGEVISTVTFESDKQHAATYGMLGAETYTSGVKKLTFTFTENNTVPSSGEFPVYFTTAPVENATFTVSVTTDQTRYRKTSAKTITFEVGKVRRFGVNLSGCEMPDGRIFTLVENVSDLVLGSDVVIAANGSKNVALSITQTTNNRSETDATKSADYSTIEVSDQVQVFTLSNGTTSGTYAFLCGNGTQAGKYIYAAASNNNYLRSQDNLDANASWTIAITNKEATITAQGANTRNVLQYNSGNKIFSCYASGQQTVYIYQAAGLPAPNLSFTNASYTFTLGDSDYTNFPGQALNNPNSISDITWSSSNTSLATVDSDGVVSFVSNATGTTTITATFGGDDFFKSGSASYTITVKAPATGYEPIETSNVTLATGSNASAAKVNNYDAIKVGTGSAGGSMTVTVPSGTTRLHLHIAAWNGANDIPVSISGASVSPASLTIQGDSGISGNSPFTLSGDPEDFYYFLGLTGINTETVITFSASSRFVIWGVNAESGPDDREESGMAWSDASATATWSSSGINFTAPTLTAGHATGIAYESTNTDVATINASGVVSIVGGGETIIKAKFDGDEDYKPSTVSYTLTVADNRTFVATPTFSPEAGTVAAGTTVTISCETAGATIYYTVDGTTPTTSSAVYSSAITIDETKTVKAIAVKENYKNSAVASAAYVVGVVNTSTESNPYSVADAREVVDELGDGTLEDVYVKGIITAITTAYNSQYGNVSFDITDDGNSNSDKFRIFRASASSADDFLVGDAVEFKGLLKKFTNNNNTIYELDGDSAMLTLIGQLHKPSISPNGGSFTTSQDVTISAASGATIRYTTNGNNPTASSSVYSSPLNLTATTTVKAIAISGILTTGVATAEFTKGSSSATLEITSGTFTGSTSSLSMTTSGITITQLKDDGTNCNTSYNTVSTLRVYRANQMKFTGKTFTKIEMYYTGTYSGADWSVVSGGGTVSIDTDNNKVVWTNTSGASTVALKNSTASGTNTQLRTTKFVVVYNN